MRWPRGLEADANQRGRVRHTGDIAKARTERGGAPIVAADLWTVSLPLREPIRWEGGVETATDFVLLRLVDAEDREGVAEVAAKPTWNGCDPEVLVLALERLALPLCQDLHSNEVRAPTGRLVENAAARALIDNALWDLARVPAADPRAVPVSWTLTRGAADAMAREAGRMAQTHGIETFKIKGGQGPRPTSPFSPRCGLRWGRRRRFTST